MRELKESGGYTVAELREYGYVVSHLRGIYSVKNIKDDGFSLDELREGGMPEHAVLAVDGRSTLELRQTGYVAKILRKIGFELYDLVEGQYTATDLRAARYEADELREMGFTAGLLPTAVMSGRILTSFAWGLLSDRIGNRRCLQLSMLAVAAGNLCFGVATSLWAALAVRFFLLGMCNGWVALIGPLAKEIGGCRQSEVLALIFGTGVRPSTLRRC